MQSSARVIVMRTRGSFLLLLVLGIIYVGYVFYPLAMLVAESVHAGEKITLEVYASLFAPTNTATLEAIVNSVLVSLLSVVFSALIGSLVALVFTQCRFPLRRALGNLAIIPLALPPLVGVIAFLFVFGESGILPRLLQNELGLARPPFVLDGIPAIIAVHSYSFNVYFYVLISNALTQLDSSVLEAAEISGSSTLRTLRKVVLPELVPALLAASILTFMTSMASFSAPLLFGGEKRFLTLQIYNAKLNGEMDTAAAVSVLLGVVSALFFVFLKWLTDEAANRTARKGTARAGTIPIPNGIKTILVGLCLLLLAIEMLPMFAIVLISFAREGSWTWQMLPTSYTIENYRKLWSDASVLQPVLNSVQMSLLTVAAAVIVGVSTAYVIVKGPLRRRRFSADVLATLPYAIPGTVIAISLILAFNKPTPFTAQTVLVGTFAILPLAYWMKLFPLVVRSTTASLVQVDDTLLEAGETFGAGAGRRFRKIILPLISPGIISGALLVMISALGEFVSSILLYTYSNRPISVEILAQMRMYNFGAAAAYSVLLLLVILFLVFSTQFLSTLKRTDLQP
jgi:iron(III) transport system permease protein